MVEVFEKVLENLSEKNIDKGIDENKIAENTISGITVGNISGGIHHSIFAGRDVNVHIHQPTDTSSSIKYIRHLTEIAVKDAEIISSEVSHKRSTDEIRLDDLYVKRSIEEEIYAFLDRIDHQIFPFILIIGEAGHGKTSLLWHIHQLFLVNAIWEPWFLKSTFFSRRTDNSLFQHLTLAVKEIRSAKQRPLILLDTVDLLLHEEMDRENLLILLLNLKSIGCPVIATCRIQEARYLNIEKDLVCRLMGYNVEELSLAIEKHVARFYERSDSREQTEHIERIQNAVAMGLPLREVCINPLTLRMLFTLYAPEEIPFEIHIFKLYQEYWDARVKQDRRAGSGIRVDSITLEKTTMAVALTMLAEGMPEIEYYLLSRGIQNFHGSCEKLEMLLSRGVLNSSEGGTIRFFHQTFFEHSAARGLIQSRKGLSLLEERARFFPNDLFVNPVYEHALLLAEYEIEPIRRQAQRGLQKLLQTESIVAKSSGIYVYAHRKQVSLDEINIVQKILRTGESVIIDYFLNVAPNIAKERLQSLFEELDIIWDKNLWKDQQHILELLERLAARDADEVIHFLERHNVLRYVLKQDPNLPGDRIVLRILTILAQNNPSYSWDGLVFLFTHTLPRTKGKDLQIEIIKTLCKQALLFGAQDIVTRFEIATSYTHKNLSQFSNSFFVTYGQLWAIEWQHSKRGISEILQELTPLSEPLLKIKLYGIAEVLSMASENEMEMAFSYFRHEQDPGKQWLWALIVFPRLLNELAQYPASTEVPSIQEIEPAAVRYLINTMTALFTAWCEIGMSKTQVAQNEEQEEMLYRQLRESVLIAIPSSTMFLSLFHVEYFLQPAPWLDEEKLARLLAHAFLTGHPGATKAIHLLVKNPEAYSQNVINAVWAEFSKLELKNEQEIDQFLYFSILSQNGVVLLKALEQIPPDKVNRLKKWVQQLDDFRKLLITSSSGSTRRIGVRLWVLMIQWDLIISPDFEELHTYLAQENDPRTRAWFAVLLGEAASKDPTYNLTGVVEVLLPLAEKGEENMRDKSLTALIKAVTKNSDDAAIFAEKLLSVVLTPPTKAGWLIQFGWILDSLTPDYLEQAATILKKLLCSPEIKKFKNQGKRTIINHLRSPCRKLIRMSPPAIQEELLDLVPQLDDILGRLIVEAICHETFDKMLPKLDELLSLPEVPGRIKELIRRNKYHRERTIGGEGWPELYTQLVS